MTSWFAVALGGAFAGWSAWELVRGLRARGWPAAPGRLLEVGAKERQIRGRRYVAAVRYEYAVGSAALSGTRLEFGWDRLYRSPERAVRALGGLVPGAAVPVRYNPRDPRDAVLRPGTRVSTVVILALGVAIMALGARP
jgi:hypothetical protein